MLEEAAGTTKIGRFQVTVDPDTLRRAQGLASLSKSGAGPIFADIPAVLPLLWLSQEEVKQALLRASQQGTLVQISQKISYDRPLELGQQYWFEIELEAEDQSLKLNAAIEDMQGHKVGRLCAGMAIILPTQGTSGAVD